MGTFRVDGEVAKVQKSISPVPVPQMLVDTGSDFSWVPEEALKLAGIPVAKKDVVFEMANGRAVTRSTGYGILRVAGLETVDEIVFAQPGDLTLLGARTLEGLGVQVDSRHKKLVAVRKHLAAPLD
jgi:predicted aspartyl protease